MFEDPIAPIAEEEPVGDAPAGNNEEEDETDVYIIKKSHINCVICREISINAMELSCCGQIVCHTCSTKIPVGQCPMCLNPSYKAVPCRVVRRIVDDMPATCPECSEKMTIGSLEGHRSTTCPRRRVVCVAPQCGAEMEYEKVWDHVITMHKADILKMFVLSEACTLRDSFASDFEVVLRRWIGGNVRFVRVFAAERAGCSGAPFHNACDGKGPTVTLIEVEGGIVGGYNALKWCIYSDESSARDDSLASFVFVLKNPANELPWRATLNPNGNRCAAWSPADKGPGFWCAPQVTSTGACNLSALGKQYWVYDGNQRGLFGGSTTVNVRRLEVWQVIRF